MTSTPEAPGHHVPRAAGELVGEDDANRWEVVCHLADGGFSSVYEVKPGTPESAAKYGTDHRALKCMTGTLDELSNIDSEAVADTLEENHTFLGRLNYNFSVLHCLPQAMVYAGAAGTGTVIRHSTLRQYARAAGFTQVDVLPIENPLWRFYRLTP